MTLPSVFAESARTSKSYWWLEDNAAQRRNILVLWHPVGLSELGAAKSDDHGVELNLRSFNAKSVGKLMHAYLLRDSGVAGQSFGITGPYSSFHIEAVRQVKSDESASCAAVFTSMSNLRDKNIISLSRSDSVPSTQERFTFTNESVQPPFPSERLALLPGVALLECDLAELHELLDVFIVSNDPSAVTSRAPDDPRDFLFSPPYCADAGTSIPLFDTQWDVLREQLILRPASTAGDIEDWPPLLRLCVACWQPGLKESLLEGGMVSIHPLDISSRTLWKHPARSIADRYREWIFLDAPVAESPTGWKETVVESERRNFFENVQSAASWQRIWRTPPYARAADPKLPVETAIGSGQGYSGTFQSSPPPTDASLQVWITWLQSMPRGNQRWGYDTLLALLKVIQELLAQRSEDSAAVQPLINVLNSCVTAGDQSGTACFNHELAVRELSLYLLAPALSELQGLNFADRNSWELPAIYFLLEFLAAQAVPQKEEDDWFEKPSRLWQHLSLAVPSLVAAQLDGRQCVVLPVKATEAALTRILIPSRRIRSAGFRLGESRLGHPANTM